MSENSQPQISSLKKKVGRRFKKLREDLHKSQEEMAEFLGIEQTTYSNWETGKNFPPLGRQGPIAEKLGVSTEMLFGNHDRDLLYLSEPQTSYNLTDSGREEQFCRSYFSEFLKQCSGSLMRLGWLRQRLTEEFPLDKQWADQRSCITDPSVGSGVGKTLSDVAENVRSSDPKEQKT